jgi:hypothetical protein
VSTSKRPQPEKFQLQTLKNCCKLTITNTVIKEIFAIIPDNFKKCVKEKALPRRMITTLMTNTKATTASNKNHE